MEYTHYWLLKIDFIIIFYFGIGKYVVCKAKGQETDYSSGRGGVQNCIFPFTQHGIRYNGCAPSVEKGKGRLCATEVDSQGNLKKWARCNKYCKKATGKLCTTSWCCFDTYRNILVKDIRETDFCKMVTRYKDYLII